MNTILLIRRIINQNIPCFSSYAWRSALLLAVCLSMLGCSPRNTQPVGSITDGVWVGHAGPDLFCFEFVHMNNEDLTGRVHSIRDGKKYSEMPFTQTLLRESMVEMEMGATQVRYKGVIELKTGCISGSLIYADGSERPMELAWMDPDGIEGFHARPAGTVDANAYTPPADSTQGFATGSVEDVGITRNQIESLMTVIIQGGAGTLHSLLVVRDGKLVVDEYFHGYEPDDLHGIASVTKSVSSLLVGIALDQGKIESIDDTIPSFFPEHSVSQTEGWNRETLRHLLTMSMGLDWTREEAEILHGTGPGFFDLVFKRLVSDEPGTRWNYVNSEADLLSGVLVHSTGMSPEEFAREYLFEPLGIRRWDWSGMADGQHRLMDGSLWLRPRDMAKIGMLVLNGGAWEGRRIISEDWIKASTTPHITTGEFLGEYGYLWWIGSLPTSMGLERVILANGWGSQFIALFPDRDMVIVTTGANEYNGKHFALAALLGQYLFRDSKE